MKLKALSHYNGDLDTRFGDCIILYNTTEVVLYDCGHVKHADVVKKFLMSNTNISKMHIVLSNNDKDHTDGVIDLLDYLYKNTKILVIIYSALYLKNAKKILDLLDDDRRTLPATKQNILETFNNIKGIIEKAQEYEFAVKNVEIGTVISSCHVVGPTEDEFVAVVAQAIEDNEITQIEGETVMNAASVQLKCTLDDMTNLLLCGDASPSFLHNLDNYNIIQLPHHGKLDNAKEIFLNLKDPYSKDYFVSDNTGSGETSGGSYDLVLYMKTEKYTEAYNTKNNIVELPNNVTAKIGNSSTQGRTYYGDLGSIKDCLQN